jgi:hypothetical protein
MTLPMPTEFKEILTEKLGTDFRKRVNRFSRVLRG